VVIDTTTTAVGGGDTYKADESIPVEARSMVVLRGEPREGDQER
jgi:hypothetical protein